MAVRNGGGTEHVETAGRFMIGLFQCLCLLQFRLCTRLYKNDFGYGFVRGTQRRLSVMSGFGREEGSKIHLPFRAGMLTVPGVRRGTIPAVGELSVPSPVAFPRFYVRSSRQLSVRFSHGAPPEFAMATMG